jgi:hypothetical protein
VSREVLLLSPFLSSIDGLALMWIRTTRHYVKCHFITYKHVETVSNDRHLHASLHIMDITRAPWVNGSS